jgi:hypothetical protein
MGFFGTTRRRTFDQFAKNAVIPIAGSARGSRSRHFPAASAASRILRPDVPGHSGAQARRETPRAPRCRRSRQPRRTACAQHAARAAPMTTRILSIGTAPRARRE